MAKHNITPTLLTKKELAKALRCSTRTIERRVKLKLIKQEKIGGSVLFNPEKIPALRLYPSGGES